MRSSSRLSLSSCGVLGLAATAATVAVACGPSSSAQLMAESLMATKLRELSVCTSLFSIFTRIGSRREDMKWSLRTMSSETASPSVACLLVSCLKRLHTLCE